MEFTTDIKEVCNSEYLVVAVPSIFMRSTMETAKDYIKEQILIDLAKGVEKIVFIQCLKLFEMF